MRRLLIDVAEAKLESKFPGSLSEFKKSKHLIEYCLSSGRIVRITSPAQINLDMFHVYHRHLLELTRRFIIDENITSWSELENHPDTVRVVKILHEFGVRGELFNEIEADDKPKSSDHVTVTQLWEMAKIHHAFKGSENAFKSWLQDQYGSLAEYCLAKGLPINATNWESHETAVRVAKKLGSISAIRSRSKSLLRYLEINLLLKMADIPELNVDHLITELVTSIWEDPKIYAQVLNKWSIEIYTTCDAKGSLASTVTSIANRMTDLMSPDELGLIYYDLCLIFDRHGSPSEREKEVTAILDSCWRSRMYPYAEQALRLLQVPFEPHSTIAAIEFILIQAITIDEHTRLDKLRLLKRSLSIKGDPFSRSLLAAANFCLHGLLDENILNLKRFMSNDLQQLSSIENCCQFLNRNGYPHALRILCVEVFKILDVDRLSHEKGAWLVRALESFVAPRSA